MNNNIKETVLTSAEKKVLSKSAILYALYSLFAFLFIRYETKTIKLGAYHIGIVLASISLLVIIALAYVIMYFKKVKFIKARRKIFALGMIIIFITTVCNIFVSSKYIFDMFEGTVTTVTNEYYITNSQNFLQFIDKDGRKVSIQVSDEIKKKLNQNELISHSFEEYFSDNELCYHKKEIRLTYYPHSNILVQFDLEE